MLILKNPLQFVPGWTAMTLACCYGKVEVLKTLLKHRANPNQMDGNGTTPLIIAIDKKHKTSTDTESVVIQLLLKRADVEQHQGDHTTPLIKAAEEGNLFITQQLLNNRANIDGRGYFQMTPLIVAASQGHLDVVERLVSQGANMKLVDFDGRNALMAAKDEANSTGTKKNGVNPHVQVFEYLCRKMQAAKNFSPYEYEKLDYEALEWSRDKIHNHETHTGIKRLLGETEAAPPLPDETATTVAGEGSATSFWPGIRM